MFGLPFLTKQNWLSRQEVINQKYLEGFGESLPTSPIKIELWLRGTSISSHATQQVRWTPADLELFPEDNKRYEIIDGALFVTRAPHLRHQGVADAICAELRAWSKRSKASEVFTGVGLVF